MVSWPKWNKTKNGKAEADNGSSQPEVRFTEAAHAKVRELLAGKSGALRILVQNPGMGAPAYGMALEESDRPEPGDTVVDAGGFTVLIDAQSVPLVNGVTVDFVDDPLRPGFKVEAPPPPPPSARPDLDLSDPKVAAIQAVIDRQVNPGIASHGGQATLIDVKGDVVYVELGGGCQGCSMASVTLKQGVEQMIKHAVPQIREVVDVTDHASGLNPFYEASAK